MSALLAGLKLTGYNNLRSNVPLQRLFDLLLQEPGSLDFMFARPYLGEKTVYMAASLSGRKLPGKVIYDPTNPYRRFLTLNIRNPALYT